MTTKRLTEASVERLKCDPLRRQEIHDEVVSGLRLRLSPNGKKSWSLMYKVAGSGLNGGRGQNRRITFGEYPLIGLKKARSLATEAKELADQGVDPADAKKAEIAGRNERRFDVLIQKFVELYARPNTKKWANTKRILEVDAVTRWRSVDVTGISRSMVHALLDEVSTAKGPSGARELRKHLSTFFNWAVDRGICSFSPMAGMKRRDLQPVTRSRTLSLDEIRSIWKAAEEFGYPFGLVIKLLILTGQRRSEVATMRRDWLNSEFIEVPADIYKTGVPQIVPLSERAKCELRDLPIWNGGDFVFSSTNGRTPVSGFSKTKVRLDKMSGVSNWTLHDIRRTVATQMAAAAVPQEHIERVLGHKISGVAGTYNRHSYFDQKLAALITWETVLFG